MRKRRQQPRGPVRRTVAKNPRNLTDEDDPLFEERDLVFSGSADEKVKPAET